MADQSPQTEEQLENAAQAGAEEAPATAADAVEQDLEQLQARAAERDEYLALAQRTQADFENYRKRATREAQVAQERGAARVVTELLPALDNLDRAIAAAEAEEDEEHHLTAGIRLVQKELSAALERVGIEAYSPKGEVFDPHQHEAVAQMPVEGAESGTIVEVYQTGYRYKEEILRAAKVVVAA